MRKRSGPRTDPCGTPVKISLTQHIILYTDKLFPFLEIRAEPFIGYAPYAIAVEFSYQYAVIDCIKSFFEINRNSNAILSFI